MSFESQENNPYTLEAVIESLNKTPNTIINLIEMEVNKISGTEFNSDLSLCFNELDNSGQRELAREILGMIGEMTVIYNNESRPDYPESRAKLKPIVSKLVRSVLEKLGETVA